VRNHLRRKTLLCDVHTFTDKAITRSSRSEVFHGCVKTREITLQPRPDGEVGTEVRIEFEDSTVLEPESEMFASIGETRGDRVNKKLKLFLILAVPRTCAKHDLLVKGESPRKDPREGVGKVGAGACGGAFDRGNLGLSVNGDDRTRDNFSGVGGVRGKVGASGTNQ
jgi:hypothetical protein